MAPPVSPSAGKSRWLLGPGALTVLVPFVSCLVGWAGRQARLHALLFPAERHSGSFERPLAVISFAGAGASKDPAIWAVGGALYVPSDPAYSGF